jgi:methionyl-tRNA formyltransferase
MRIVFIGAVQFSEKALAKLTNIKADVVGVCTLEKSPFNADHVDLTHLCNENNIPVRYTPDINSTKSYNWIRSYNPDVIFCFGWSRLLKTKILNLAPLGVVGYHPAALPANRGRHPLIWALALGLDKTASTFFFMDDGADSGDIISQQLIKIKANDNAGTLYQKMTETAINQLEEFVPELESGSFERTPQDHDRSNTWRKRNINDGRIDWRMSAESIHNLVRGLSHPYVGAHFDIKDKEIKVWETKLVSNNEKNIEPGKIIEVNFNGPIIKTDNNAIQLIDIEPTVELIQGSYL